MFLEANKNPGQASVRNSAGQLKHLSSSSPCRWTVGLSEKLSKHLTPIPAQLRGSHHETKEATRSVNTQKKRRKHYKRLESGAPKTLGPLGKDDKKKAQQKVESTTSGYRASLEIHLLEII